MQPGGLRQDARFHHLAMGTVDDRAERLRETPIDPVMLRRTPSPSFGEVARRVTRGRSASRSDASHAARPPFSTEAIPYQRDIPRERRGQGLDRTPHIPRSPPTSA
jgi:hypothetical protein